MQSHPPAAHCLHGAGQGASGQPCFPFVWEEKSCSSAGFGTGSTLRGRAVPDGIPTPQLGVGRGCRLTAAMATWLPTTSAFLFQFNPCPSWLRDLPSAKPRVTERNNLVLHQASFHCCGCSYSVVGSRCCFIPLCPSPRALTALEVALCYPECEVVGRRPAKVRNPSADEDGVLV